MCLPSAWRKCMRGASRVDLCNIQSRRRLLFARRSSNTPSWHVLPSSSRCHTAWRCIYLRLREEHISRRSTHIATETPIIHGPTPSCSLAILLWKAAIYIASDTTDYPKAGESVRKTKARDINGRKKGRRRRRRHAFPLAYMWQHRSDLRLVD